MATSSSNGIRTTHPPHGEPTWPPWSAPKIHAGVAMAGARCGPPKTKKTKKTKKTEKTEKTEKESGHRGDRRETQILSGLLCQPDRVALDIGARSDVRNTIHRHASGMFTT
jgi:hypothetical protein